MKIKNSDLIKFITEEVREAVGLDYSNDSREKYQTGKFGAPVVENDWEYDDPLKYDEPREKPYTEDDYVHLVYLKLTDLRDDYGLETLKKAFQQFLRDNSSNHDLNEQGDLKIEFVLKTLLQALPPENRKDRRVQDVLRDAAEKLVQVILVEGDEEAQGGKQYEQNSSDDELREQIRQLVREEAEEKGNPWAICTDSVGREDKAKYERCVQKVKKKTGYKK